MVADVDHRPLPGHLRDVALQEVARELKDKQTHVNEDECVQSGVVADEDVIVHCDLGEKRPCLTNHRCDENQDERQHHPRRVRFEVAKKTQHQPHLERLLADLFLVDV